MDSRQRPLQTCWIALLEISSKAYTTASRNYNGENLVNFASPSVICALQCKILAILAILDDGILRIESLAEFFFPPLKQFFDGIDELVKSAEGLPEKLDDTIKKFPTLVHQVPFLDWALVRSIYWLRFLITVMSNFGIVGVKDKDINVAGVNKPSNEGLMGKRRRKKTKKMDVQIITSKDGLNPSDQLLATKQAITNKKLTSNNPEMVEGKSKIITQHNDVQTVMIDRLMVQQEADRLTILAGNEVMEVHGRNEKNDDSLGVDEKYTNIDSKADEETKESESTRNDELVKISYRDIDDQTFKVDGPTIIQESVHQTFLTTNDEQIVEDTAQNNDNIQRIDKILTSNDSKATEGTKKHILTSNEKPKITVEGIDDQTFTSNGSMDENGYDHQASYTRNDEIIIQKNNENNNFVPDTDKKSHDDHPRMAEGTVKQLGLTSNGKQGISTQVTGDLTSYLNGFKIEQATTDNPTLPMTQENGDQMIPWNESEIDQSVTSNGSTLVSETDETTMDSDCSQFKSGRKIFAPFRNEHNVAGIPGTSSSNVIKGSYKDVLAMGKHESIEEIHRHKGLRPDKSRRQGKKVAKGTHEENIEGKGRRKGKKKKVDKKI
ncbi:unnamed protein product [Linum tenue]|uniref:Uncharacterized protein n=1 Tax=Linum tenue TaxID=586396 RepID=A0AAV0S435_9ROSI|nr:unnamed protein product [Linum tenue]